MQFIFRVPKKGITLKFSLNSSYLNRGIEERGCRSVGIEVDDREALLRLSARVHQGGGVGVGRADDVRDSVDTDVALDALDGLFGEVVGDDVGEPRDLLRVADGPEAGGREGL